MRATAILRLAALAALASSLVLPAKTATPRVFGAWQRRARCMLASRMPQHDEHMPTLTLLPSLRCVPSPPPRPRSPRAARCRRPRCRGPPGGHSLHPLPGGELNVSHILHVLPEGACCLLTATALTICCCVSPVQVCEALARTAWQTAADLLAKGTLGNPVSLQWGGESCLNSARGCPSARGAAPRRFAGLRLPGSRLCASGFSRRARPPAAPLAGPRGQAD